MAVEFTYEEEVILSFHVSFRINHISYPFHHPPIVLRFWDPISRVLLTDEIEYTRNGKDQNFGTHSSLDIQSLLFVEEWLFKHFCDSSFCWFMCWRLIEKIFKTNR